MANYFSFNYLKFNIILLSFYNCLLYFNFIYFKNISIYQLYYLQQNWQRWHGGSYLTYYNKINYYFLCYKQWVICFIYIFYNFFQPKNKVISARALYTRYLLYKYCKFMNV